MLERGCWSRRYRIPRFVDFMSSMMITFTKDGEFFMDYLEKYLYWIFYFNCMNYCKLYCTNKNCLKIICFSLLFFWNLGQENRREFAPVKGAGEFVWGKGARNFYWWRERRRWREKVPRICTAGGKRSSHRWLSVNVAKTCGGALSSTTNTKSNTCPQPPPACAPTPEGVWGRSLE